MEFIVPSEHITIIQNHFYNESVKYGRKRKDFTNHALYILHTLKIKQSFKRESLNGFYLLNKTILESIISKAKRIEIIRFLVDIELIEVNNNYLFKTKNSTNKPYSKGYRLTNKANSSAWIKHIVKDRLLVYKLDKWEQRIHIESKKKIAQKKGGYQISHYWLSALKIDFENSMEYITQFEPKKYDAYKYQIESIKNKKQFAVIDDNGRFHHNLTNLKKELRTFLSIDNQSLIGLDIVNSQATFLGLWLRDKGLSIDEVNNYLRLCSNGSIYEYINGSDFEDKESRTTFKKKLFASVFFGKVRNMDTSVAIKFKDKFPGITQTIKDLKNKYGSNYIANNLQSQESKFVFDCIDYIKTNIGNEVPLISLHDAIYTTLSNIDDVEILAYRYSQEKTSSMIKFASE